MLHKAYSAICLSCLSLSHIMSSSSLLRSDLLTLFRELENMAHGGRPLPSNPALARPSILWAEDFVAIAGSLPLVDPQGGLKPLPESGPYVQPVSFQGATALHLASFYGHLGVTDLLLAAGACDVTAPNIQVSIPIVNAAARSNICTLLPALCYVGNCHRFRLCCLSAACLWIVSAWCASLILLASFQLM